MSQSKERQPQRSAGGGEQATSTSDHTYGLVSVLYHALQGAETYIQYIQDAQEAGDEALVSFFRECQEEERDRASRAKLLLAERLEDEGDADEDEDEDEDEEDE
jgi:rubrerythrin